MASKAFLRALRKKYGLGEFKRRKGSGKSRTKSKRVSIKRRASRAAKNDMLSPYFVSREK